MLVPLTQPQDEEYGRLIREHMIDRRFQTELTDHMPASDTVPSMHTFPPMIDPDSGFLTFPVGRANDLSTYTTVWSVLVTPQAFVTVSRMKYDPVVIDAGDVSHW